MQSLHYYILAGIAIAFLAGCLLYLRENDIFPVDVIKKFRRLIYVLSIGILLDTVFALLIEQNAAAGLLYAVKTTELIIAPTIAFLVFEIFYNKKANTRDHLMRNMRKAIIIALAFNAVLQLASLVGGFIYYIDTDGVYHRGVLAFAYIMIIVFTACIVVYEIIVFSNKTQSTMKLTLISFVAILAIGITLRMAFGDSNYDSLCMAVSVLFLLMYYSHITLEVDPLTHLLNRLVYQRMLKRIDYTTVIVMIDVNNLKIINDTFGHKCGDHTLKQIAHLIYKTYRKYAYCFRIGGDEFCLILKPNVFDKLLEEVSHHDVYSMTESFIQRLDEQILRHQGDSNESYSYMKFGVSHGYGIYYAEDSYYSNHDKMSLEKVVELADKMMYRSKEAHKADHPNLDTIAKADLKRAEVLYTPSKLELIDHSAKE